MGVSMQVNFNLDVKLFTFKVFTSVLGKYILVTIVWLWYGKVL